MTSELVEKFLQVNRARWNELVDVHAGSAHYDLEGFLAGEIRLRDYEIEDVGDVTGKTLLHLQCHFGIETLSWARLGARVTGVDFSDKAVELGARLAEQAGLEGRFVCSDVNTLPDVLDDRFDIVYTSRGVLHWLPDLKRWAEVIEHFLVPGGFFYVTEGHPVAQIFDEDRGDGNLRIRFPYFERRKPDVMLVDGSYADPTAAVDNRLEFGWSHSLGEVVSSLAAAGLHIDFLREEPEGEWPKSFLERTEAGTWRYPSEHGELPLWFSLRASRPAP